MCVVEANSFTGLSSKCTASQSRKQYSLNLLYFTVRFGGTPTVCCPIGISTSENLCELRALVYIFLNASKKYMFLILVALGFSVTEDNCTKLKKNNLYNVYQKA
jgi:hypothetical protein